MLTVAEFCPLPDADWEMKQFCESVDVVGAGLSRNLVHVAELLTLGTLPVWTTRQGAEHSATFAPPLDR